MEEADPYNILVKYEGLVLDSANESRRLSEYLGVRLDIGAVEKQVSQLAHHMTSKTARESVERWRQELPTELNEFFLKSLRKESCETLVTRLDRFEPVFQAYHYFAPASIARALPF